MMARLNTARPATSIRSMQRDCQVSPRDKSTHLDCDIPEKLGEIQGVLNWYRRGQDRHLHVLLKDLGGGLRHAGIHP